MWDWFDELFDDALDWLDEHGFDVHQYFADDDDGHWIWIGDSNFEDWDVEDGDFEDCN